MEVANEVMKGVVQVFMVPVKKHLGYLISYRNNVDDMHTKMRELNVARDGETEHLERNTRSRLEVPAQVSPWLKEVEQMNVKVEANFASEVPGCLNLKSRHKLGRKVFKITKEINSVTTQHALIRWTDLQIPLGRIDSTTAGTSQPSSGHNDFKSRDKTYNKALKALGPDHKPHMVALWGMGGVGKTTMMKKLKQVVVEKNMFRYFVEAVIGEKTDPIAIQQAVADYLGIKLTESTKPARADKLHNWFANNSNGGKNKFLLILDDVWQSVDLEDIGLSRLPNQGVDFKVLITSRDQAVCTEMGVEVDSILKVRFLKKAEAQSLFNQFLGSCYDVDPELHEIGEDILRKCCGLPIAIKTMACTLRNKNKDTWKNALSRLEHHDINTVAPTVFKMSYDNLQDEVTGAIFLLCGLFPEDFHICTEDLLRYGWGLQLFKGVGTIREARYMLNACIERLMHTNLLIESDDFVCVKMHDLVRDFVLDMFSKVEHASIVNHGSKPGWPENGLSASCKRISLTCKGMYEFPSDLKFPNLSIMKLMHGYKSLRFRQNFYQDMEKLKVISYDQMESPLLPSSLKCSANLRVLRLHQCSLAFDCSSIGNLVNLEVLSLASSFIGGLPSTIRNLTKLRVLDVKDSYGLCIDNGIFKNLVRLEELYACSFDRNHKASDNCYEVTKRWNNLSALEFEFLKNNAQWKNLSFENLELFKISVGRSLQGEDFTKSKHPFRNILKLETKKGELLGCRINELFEKTVVLCLSVDDINDLEDVDVNSSFRPQSSSFCNVKVLVILECAELRYLFSVGVANVLSNLEHLEVFDCPVIKELIHLESGGEERVTFPNLKFLSLCRLPNLSGLCQNVNIIIALPQLMKFTIKGIPNIASIYSKNKSATSCLFREKVLVPKLEKLCIRNMKNLYEIWPCDFRTIEEVKLREIEVRNCDNLVNLFPCNPLPLLCHLEQLDVWKCGSVESLFDMEVDCVGKIREEERTSKLRRIDVYESGKLRGVWRIRGGENNSGLPIRGFQAVESIRIMSCGSFRNVFSPTTTNFDIGSLIDLDISSDWGRISWGHNGLVESNQEQENTLFPSYLIHSFHNLHELRLSSNQGVEVVFEIDSDSNNQHRMLSNLEELNISDMKRMSHVWKCNWNKFLILQKHEIESPFHNLTTICMLNCDSIEYLFSPLMARLLSNLKKISIYNCGGIKDVVSHGDDEENTTSTFTHATTTLFPHLYSLTLKGLQNLKCIGGNNEISFNTTTAFLDQYKFSQVDGASWSLCQYPREISITKCDALSSVVPRDAAGQMQNLEVLKIESCEGMKEVFETQGINKSVITLELPNLKILEIRDCGLLEHLFTFSTLESLRQLEELNIENCKAMKVIVVKAEEQTRTTAPVVKFPRLKSIKLVDLPEMVGFFLGTNIEFQWPSLDELTIYNCPRMKAFTAGGSTAPQLKYVETRLGKHLPRCWFNSHVTTTTTGLHHQTTPFPSLESRSSCWSFHNLIELHVKDNRSFKKIIPSKELLRLQNLEKIKAIGCDLVKEVFEGTNSGFDGSQSTVVKLQNLTEVELKGLVRLRHIWKSNFEFPKLTRVYIEGCNKLKHVFSSFMVGSLLQLQELHIIDCSHIEEVFVQDQNIFVQKEGEKSDGKMNEMIVFPRLKYLKLESLQCLKGFSLGKEDFSFPLLGTLTIEICPTITTFTTGNSFIPELKEIKTGFGSFYVEDDINSFIKIKQQELKRDNVKLLFCP